MHSWSHLFLVLILFIVAFRRIRKNCWSLVDWGCSIFIAGVLVVSVFYSVPILVWVGFLAVSVLWAVHMTRLGAFRPLCQMSVERDLGSGNGGQKETAGSQQIDKIEEQKP